MANIFGDMPGAELVAKTESDRGAGSGGHATGARTAGAGCPRRAWIGSALLVVLGCGGGGVPSEGEDEATRQKALAVIADLQDPPPPMNKMYSFNVLDGQARDVRVADVPGAAEPGGPQKEFQPVASRPKIGRSLSADLEAEEAGTGSDRTVEVMVTLKENLRMPRFPDHADGEPRDSAANTAARARADQLVSAIQNFRTPGYNSLAKVFAARYGATEKERFWLINAMKVQMPLSKVRELAARDDVQYVGYTQAGSPPSDPARPGTDISDGRARIQSDPYYGYQNAWIGMLDTGTRPHILNNDGESFIRDCIRGIADNCQTGEGLQPNEVSNDHGTGSMSILFGTNDLGNPSRGVTDIVVDSWKVCEGGYDDVGCVVDAGARALLAAVASQDKVIMVNMQADEPEWGGLSRAADQAFDAGSVVVAAAGNFGNTDGANCVGDPIWGSVRAPGNAHKALAVGAIDVHSCFDPRRSARNWPGKSARGA